MSDIVYGEEEDHLKAALLRLEVAAKLADAMSISGVLGVPESNTNRRTIQRLRDEAASLAKQAVKP